MLLFFNSNRPGGFGAFDLYYATRPSQQSPWEQAINLGSKVNTASDDKGPNISPDGSLLYFHSSRPGGAGAAALDHPHIVPVYSIGSEQDAYFYAMKYIDGPSLADTLAEMRRSNELPSSSEYFRKVALWGIQAAEALNYAHSKNVIHGDVKPSNLLVDKDGSLWLIDFGAASCKVITYGKPNANVTGRGHRWLGLGLQLSEVDRFEDADNAFRLAKDQFTELVDQFGRKPHDLAMSAETLNSWSELMESRGDLNQAKILLEEAIENTSAAFILHRILTVNARRLRTIVLASDGRVNYGNPP